MHHKDASLSFQRAGVAVCLINTSQKTVVYLITCFQWMCYWQIGGLNIRDAAGAFCAEVRMPPLTKGKKQLSQCEVDRSCQLSRIRIHVERVIGVLKQKYSLLESTIPINFIMTEDTSMIDKIATVYSALCNCCLSYCLSSYSMLQLLS